MGYDEFKEKFVEDVKERIADKGLTADVRTVEKVNETYEALSVTPEGGNIGMNLNIDRFYSSYEDGVDYEDLVNNAMDVIDRGISNIPDLDVNKFTDYEQMKDKLVMEVVSAETNAAILATIPHKRMEDMAVVYRFMLDSHNGEQASVLVTNTIINQMDITPEQLHADALKNAPEVKPLVIQGMSEVMAEMLGPDQAELMGLMPVAPEDEQMYVASVPDKTHGASVIAYQDFMDRASDRVGGDFFILPSSIHEVLIIPDNKEIDFKVLEGMVRDVNETQVAPEDKLTDNVYHYDSKDKIFELAEKFFERQNERGEDSPDKEEKVSVLDDLKAKKEEVAKSPRKEAIDKGAKSRGGEAI